MIDLEERFDTIEEMEAFMKRIMPTNIYDDVELLQQKVAGLEIRTADSGWHALQLKEGITAYNEEQRPSCRRIGEVVFLAGVFRGVSEVNTDIAMLPEGFRPAKKVILPFTGIATKINRMEILTDGTIRFSRSTIEPTQPENWNSIACCFSIPANSYIPYDGQRNIYDDVEELQQKTTELLEQVIELEDTKLSGVVTNLNGVDLNEAVGKIIIGYGNNCLNRPTGQNGYLINIPHAELPDKYNKQLWLTRPANNMFVRSMEDGTFGEWTPIRYDGGWHDLPLGAGVTAQNASEYPCRFRKINNRVYVEGCVKGLTSSSQIVCTLPEEYRPVQRYYFQAPTNAGGTDTFRVNLNGTIDWAATTGTVDASNWHFITTSFLVD